MAPRRGRAPAHLTLAARMGFGHPPRRRMDTRDLLLLIGFLRSGRMFPAAVPVRALPAQRSPQEQRRFGATGSSVIQA